MITRKNRQIENSKNLYFLHQFDCMNKSWNSFIQIALYLSLISRKTLSTQNQFDEKMEKNSFSYTTKILREMNVQH